MMRELKRSTLDEGSKRFTTNEKGDPLDHKSSRILIQNALKLFNNTFW